MAAELKVKSGGSWRTITAPEVKYSGSWRAIKTIEVKSGGVWREVFASIIVSPATTGDYNSASSGTVYAGVSFNSDSVEYEYNAVGGQYSLGNWLDSGLNSEVWVERVITSGSFNSIDAGAGRLQLSTTRSFRLSRSASGSKTCQVTFNFYDAASGGNLLFTTGSILYEAERTI